MHFTPSSPPPPSLAPSGRPTLGLFFLSVAGQEALLLKRSTSCLGVGLMPTQRWPLLPRARGAKRRQSGEKTRGFLPEEILANDSCSSLMDKV